MTIVELLNDKTKKAKEKMITISKWLSDDSMPTDELIAFAEKAKDTEKATCIEAIEYATKLNPKLADESVFAFVTRALTEKAPRVKWESARVIGNIAHQFTSKLDEAICNLLENSSYEGTVVRWASAHALGEILKLKTKHNKVLLPAIEALSKSEEVNGIKKKYLDALKKVSK
jgi:HEAT repeat protein